MSVEQGWEQTNTGLPSSECLTRLGRRRGAGAIDGELRILFITGFSAVALRSRGTRLPEAKVVSKPFHPRALVEEIEKLLTA